MKSKSQTIKDIDETIMYLTISAVYLKYTGSQSDHVYQSQFDQFITTTEKTINDLYKIKESLE